MQHTPRRQDATFGPARRFMPLDAPPPAPRPESLLASLPEAFLGLLRFWAHRPNRQPDRATGKRKKHQRNEVQKK
jgi:hypothetical protein